MDELSLDDLLGALQSAQDEKPKVRLSERNVVELVNKLKAAGLLGDGLLHTVNGREYVTRQHLKKEVITAVDAGGGRIPLVELPAVVGVNLLHCQQQAAEAVAESRGALQLLQGELITTAYFDTLAAEVADSLMESGAVTVAQVASESRLAVNMLLPVLAARMGSIIPGKVEGGLLYTDAHLARVKARVRGCVRGAIAPVSLPSVAKAAGLDSSTASAGPSLASVVEQLVAEGQVAGHLGGGGTTWLPAIHAQRQLEHLMQSFRQDRVVQWAAAAKLAVADPRERLLAEFPGDMELPHSLLGAEVAAEADSAVDAALEDGSWVDIALLLPTELSSDDVAQLVERLPAVQRIRRAASGSRVAATARSAAGQDSLVSSTAVVSAAFVSGVESQLVQYAQEVAQQAQQRVTPPTASAASQEAEGSPTTPAAKQSAEAASAYDSDNDWDKGGGKGKGKKGKIKNVSRKGKASGAPTPASSGKTSAKSAKKGGGEQQQQQVGRDAGASLLATASLAARILEWYPDLADAEGLAVHLAEKLRGSAVTEYQTAQQSHFVARSGARRQACHAAAVAMQSTATRLRLLCGGIPVVADEDDDLAAVLHRHLLRTAGAEAVDAMLRFLEAGLQNDTAASSPAADATSGAAPLPPPQRAALLQRLPDDVAPPARAAVACLTGSDTQELLTCLEAAAEAGGWRLQWPDKRSERREVAAHLAEVVSALEGCRDPPTALSLAVPLLVVKCFGKAVSLPGRALSPAIARLQQGSGLSAVDHQTLAEFHSKVVEVLSGSAGNGDIAATQDVLQAQLADLKRMAGVSGHSPNEEQLS